MAMNNRTLRPRRKAAGGDSLWQQVALLLHMDGADGSQVFADSSLNNLPVSYYGDVQVDTADKKFGTGAALFDGAGDSLTVDVSSLPRFGVGGTPYTIEMWAYVETGGTDVLLSRNGGAASWSATNGLQINVYADGSSLVCEFANASGGNTSLIGSAFTRDAWVHVAVCYDGTTTRLFVDGAEKASSTVAYGERSGANTLEIGRQQGQYDFSRSIDELRITIGANAARYTSNFTPPTAAFPNG